MASEYLFLQVAWGDGQRTINVVKMPSNGAPPLKFTRAGDGESAGDGFIRFLNDLGQLGWDVFSYAPTPMPRAQQSGAATWARSASSEFEPPAGAYLLTRLSRPTPGAGDGTEKADPAPHSEPRTGGLEDAYWEAQQESEYVVSLDKVRNVLSRAHDRMGNGAGVPVTVPPEQ